MSLKDKVLSKLGLDENEDFGLEDIAALTLRFDGDRVDRKEFLQETLQGKYAQEIIDKMISEGPVAAEIQPEELKNIISALMEQAEAEVTLDAKKEDLKEALQEEESNIIEKAKEVVETVHANRYQQEWNKLAQKVLYLYGFPELEINDDGALNGDKSKILMMLVAADMLGIENAGEAVKAMARVLPQMKGKAISTQQLNSNDISEILKKWTCQYLGKDLIMNAVRNIPVLGGKLISGSYSDKLEKSYGNLLNTLSDTALSNSQHKPGSKELDYAEKLLAMIQD